MKKVFFLWILALFLSGNVLAYNNQVTHKSLTEISVEKSDLSQYVIDNFNLPGGAGTHLGDKTIMGWIQEGAFLEDEPACRASNHFHNPIIPNWLDAGIQDLFWVFKGICNNEGEYPANEATSAVRWGTGYAGPGDKNLSRNPNDWDAAQKGFYIALTGKDFFGNQIWKNHLTEDKTQMSEEKQAVLKTFFRDLGYVLHLLQDMAVPAHVRSDFMSHMEWKGINGKDFKKWVYEKYEDYVMRHDKIIFDPLLDDPQKVAEIPDTHLTDPEVWKFWDTDQYGGSSTDPGLLDFDDIGLAEFTNLNFVTRNTKLTANLKASNNYYQPYPMVSNTDIKTYMNKPPEAIFDEDGVPIRVQFVKKYGDGESNGYGPAIEHFLVPGYLSESVGEHFSEDDIYNKTFMIDDTCAQDYANILIPKAISYSVALLDFFFRGEIELTADSEGCYIVNPMDEDMEGEFELYYDNTNDERVPIMDVDGKPWGKFNNTINVISVAAGGQSVPLDLFALPEDAKKPGEMTLVMKGSIGEVDSTLQEVAASKITIPLIEISLPEEGYYAFTDRHPYYDPSDPKYPEKYMDNPAEQGFNKIIVNAVSQAGDLTDGTVSLQVKYRQGLEDQFSATPGATTYFTFYQIVAEKQISEAQGTIISSGSPTKLEFDLPVELPLWATDVHLFLIYNGSMGTETDALCLGYKDISEPTPVDFFNLMDKICMNNTLYDAGSAAAIAIVDEDQDGIANPWEFDVYPHKITNLSIRFEENSDWYYDTGEILPGEYARLFYLGEYVNQPPLRTLTTYARTDENDAFIHLPVSGSFYRPGRANQMIYGDYCPDGPCLARWLTPFSVSFRGLASSRGILFINLEYQSTPYPDGCKYDDVN